MQGDLFGQRDRFLADIRNGEKKDCPCCGRYAQVYSRRIHKTIAQKLVHLHRLGGAQAYVHTSNLVFAGEAGVGDFSKAKYWGLIEEAKNENIGKRNSGHWKLTQKGIDFVQGRITIPARAIVFDDRVLDFAGEQVSIRECIESSGFDYSELMEGKNDV